MKHLKRLVERYGDLLEENRRLKRENRVLKEKVDALEDDLLLCRKEIRYIKEIKEKALRRLERVIDQIDKLR